MKNRLFLAVICILFGLFLDAHAQTPVMPYVNPKVQFFDANGAPLASGCIFSYQAGTTTPQNTYTVSDGSSANTNPIILDAGGFATIWLGMSAYKLVAVSTGGTACASGVTQWTADNISEKFLRTDQANALSAIADPGGCTLGLLWMSTNNAGRLKWCDSTNIRTAVGTDTTDTLTNKTLASPVVTGTLAAASETLSGLLTNYNGIATVKNGVSAEYATVDLGSQSADISTATLYAVPSSGSGLYRVSVYIVVNRAGTVSSTLPAVQISYTDSDSSGVITQATSTSGGNVTTTAMQSVFIVNAKASTNIAYATSGYASSGATSMQFTVHIRVEAI